MTTASSQSAATPPFAALPAPAFLALPVDVPEGCDIDLGLLTLRYVDVLGLLMRMDMVKRLAATAERGDLARMDDLVALSFRDGSCEFFEETFSDNETVMAALERFWEGDVREAQMSDEPGRIDADIAALGPKYARQPEVDLVTAVVREDTVRFTAMRGDNPVRTVPVPRHLLEEILSEMGDAH